jgi:HEAT repeat protein
MRSLGQLGDPRALEPLTAALSDAGLSTSGNPIVCQFAAQALGRLGDPRAIEPLRATIEEGRGRFLHERR